MDLRGIVAGIGDADRHRGADQNGGIDLKHKIIIVINVQALQNIADAVAAALSVYDGLILFGKDLCQLAFIHTDAVILYADLHIAADALGGKADDTCAVIELI